MADIYPMPTLRQAVITQKASMDVKLKTPMESVLLLFASHRWGTWGLARLSSLSESAQLVNGKASFRAGTFNYFATELISHLGMTHKAQNS